MKKNIFILLFILIYIQIYSQILINFNNGVLSSQMFHDSTKIFTKISINEGDSIMLTINDYRGIIYWQTSTDLINWSNLPVPNTDSVVIIPTNNAYYRAKVVEGTCQPIYSDTQFVSVISFTCGDTLIDPRDGQKYPTVQIGSQCWLAKNLNIGVMIQGTQTQTNNGIIEKYCYANNQNNCNTYGGLYQWDELMQYTTIESTQGICPDGWHIPSDGEIKTLEIALGMTPQDADLVNAWRGTDQGTQMKVGGSSGYDALLCGRYIPVSGGSFSLLNQYEYIWSSTEYGSNAWRRCLSASSPQVGRYNTFPKNYGFSVRCVKD